MTQQIDNLHLENLKFFLPPHLSRLATTEISNDTLSTMLIHLTTLSYTICTYLPRYLVDLVRTQTNPDLVNGGFRYGTVMFADVSGFTAMSEKLTALGREGAEEVTRIVNDYFDTMLDISSLYEGDLLKFGGDALLLFFEGEDGPHRALATAETMQAAMARFDQVKTSQGVFSLKMSIGAGTGPVFVANLGSGEKMEYTVMGRTLTQMAQAEGQAVAGQVMVDQATRDTMADKANFEPADNGLWLFNSLSSPIARAEHKVEGSNVPSLMQLMLQEDAQALWERCLAELSLLERLRPFVPDELVRQLIIDPQRETVPGSHRPVTIMFANFYGIDEIIEALGPDHEDAITQILNAHFVTMSRILARYKGVVNKVDSYAIGHRIMAMFGALQASEDDPQLAARAALEMNAALVEVNDRTREILANIPNLNVDFGDTPLKQRIGLNTGFVFAGNVGSSTRREYSVMGDEVNLTARLMSVAEEGQVLVSGSVVRHAKDEFSLEEKTPVTVKGKTEPVRNFVITGENVRPTRWATIATGPIVGRDKELALGKQATDKACMGDGRVVIISGTSGIGKTRLAEEVVYYGQSQNMRLMAGTCLSYGQTMPYHPWVDILRTCLGIRNDISTQEKVAAVQAGLAEINERDWAPIMGDILHLEIPENDLTRSLDAKLRRQRVLDLTLKLLQYQSQQQPVMLIVEDTHWADSSSMDLLVYISRNIRGFPILMLLLHRPDDNMFDSANQDHIIDLPIGDLGPEAAMEIVQNMIGPIDLPESLRTLILSKGGGNPFFIEEVVRALSDEGALTQDENGQWQVAHDMAQVELPGTIHGIIISRIDRLLETDRRLLQVASVVGSVFARYLVEGVYPYSDFHGSIVPHLRYLDGRGLTEDEPAHSELHRFKHLTTREVVYESQSFDERRSLHRRIADYIEQSAESSIEELDLLAYHYFDGQDWGKAIYYNLKAARRAQREFANDTAITAYQRTMDAAMHLDEDTTVEELIARESLGEVSTLMGRYDDALDHYAAAREIVEAEATSNDQAVHLGELCRKTADVYEKRSEYDTAYLWLDKGLAYLKHTQQSIEEARIYLLKAGVSQRQGRHEAALNWSEKSLESASQISGQEARQVVAQAYYNLGGVHIRRGDFEQAIYYCQESVDVYRSIDDMVGESQALINLGNAYSDQGDLNRSAEAHNRSLEIKQKIGDVLSQGILANNLGNTYLYRGDWEEALNRFKQSTDIWKQVGAPAFEAVTLSNLAQVHIYMRHWDDAHNALSQSQTIFASVGSEDFLPELERRWGELYLATDAPDEALAHAQASIDLAIKQQARLEEGMTRRLLGQIFTATQQWDMAKESLVWSHTILDELHNEYEATKTRLTTAQLHMLCGEQDLAVPHLQTAIETFERLGANAALTEAHKLQREIGS